MASRLLTQDMKRGKPPDDLAQVVNRGRQERKNCKKKGKTDGQT